MPTGAGRRAATGTFLAISPLITATVIGGLLAFTAVKYETGSDAVGPGPPRRLAAGETEIRQQFRRVPTAIAMAKQPSPLWAKLVAVATPEVRYAKTLDGAHFALVVLGEGPIDLVEVGNGSNMSIEAAHDEPRRQRYVEALGSFTRFVGFDPRGIGLDLKRSPCDSWRH